MHVNQELIKGLQMLIHAPSQDPAPLTNDVAPHIPDLLETTTDA